MPFYLLKDLPEAAMKNNTIYFYSDPAEGSRLGKSLIVRDRANKEPSFMRDASTFDGTEANIGRVVVLPSVRPHQRERIAAAYGDIVEQYAPAEEVEQKPKADTVDLTDDPTKKQAVNRGRGRWFVVRGDVTLSGPHTQSEAEEIAGAP